MANFFKNKKQMIKDLPKVLGTSVAAGGGGLLAGYAQATLVPQWKRKVKVKDAAGVETEVDKAYISPKMSAGGMILVGILGKAITDNPYANSVADGVIGVSSVYAAAEFQLLGEKSKSMYGLAGVNGAGVGAAQTSQNNDQYIDWDAQNALLMQQMNTENSETPYYPNTEETPVSGVQEESVATKMM